MVVNQALRYAFNKQRLGGAVGASTALFLARRAIWNQVWGAKAFHTSSPWRRMPPPFGGAPSDSVRWIEGAESNGFRLVGFADEILERLGHTGWYRDVFQDETYRGAVLQLPGRKGEARFVAAYADPDNDGAYRVDLTIYSESTREGSKWDSAKDLDACRDAARAADSFAEHEAEESKEYDRAWQAGAQWAQRRDEERETRKHALALAGEARALRRKVTPQEAPTVCAALRSQFQSLVDSIGESRSERAKLASGDYSKGDFYLGFYPSEKLQAAFCEGAGIKAFPA